ncbi:MAG TPA: cytochrome P450 [Solirubrobacteraceae bacterium]|nr:cytochrome P450 [Solirubrobacteraceae bacterium]
MCPTVSHVDEPITYDPFEFHEDPYPMYARLREEDPAHYNRERDLWALTRFADIQLASRQWKTYSSGEGVVLDDESDFYAPGGFVDQDPPSHDRLRKVIAKYFTPKSSAQLTDFVRARAQALLEPARETGSMDVVADLARPLPTDVVSKIIGVPEEDHSLTSAWFIDMLERVPGQIEAPPEAWAANQAMRDYMAALIAERLKQPRDDLATILAEAEHDGRLSNDETVGMCVFMFYSGIITTAALLANSVLNLLDFPDELEKIRRGDQPMSAVVEELLRYDAPIQSLRRVMLEPATLHDKEIPAGASVLLMWASANRDDRRWPDPNRIDINRPGQRHLAFGEGIHHCLGAPLARLEAIIAFDELFTNMPRYELAGPVSRLHTPHERGLRTMPIVFEAA